MKTENVTKLLSDGSINKFEEIFRVYHYSRKELCEATGIGYYRARTIIDDPSKMRCGEIYLIAEHFSVEGKILSSVIFNSIRSSDRSRYGTDSGKV